MKNYEYLLWEVKPQDWSKLKFFAAVPQQLDRCVRIAQLVPKAAMGNQ